MSESPSQIAIPIPSIKAEDITDAIVERLLEDIQGVVLKLVRERVSEEADKQIRLAADTAVSDYLTKKMPRTNTWGEKTGEDQSITEFICGRFEKYMQERVDYQGSRTSGNSGHPREKWLVEQFGLKEIEKVAAAEIAKVRKAAEVQIAAAVGNFISQNIVAPVAASQLTHK